MKLGTCKCTGNDAQTLAPGGSINLLYPPFFEIAGEVTIYVHRTSQIRLVQDWSVGRLDRNAWVKCVEIQDGWGNVEEAFIFPAVCRLFRTNAVISETTNIDPEADTRFVEWTPQLKGPFLGTPHRGLPFLGSFNPGIPYKQGEVVSTTGYQGVYQRRAQVDVGPGSDPWGKDWEPYSADRMLFQDFNGPYGYFMWEERTTFAVDYPIPDRPFEWQPSVGSVIRRFRQNGRPATTDILQFDAIPEFQVKEWNRETWREIDPISRDNLIFPNIPRAQKPYIPEDPRRGPAPILIDFDLSRTVQTWTWLILWDSNFQGATSYARLTVEQSVTLS